MEDYIETEIKELRDFEITSHVVLREKRRIDQLEKKLTLYPIF